MVMKILYKKKNALIKFRGLLKLENCKKNIITLGGKNDSLTEDSITHLQIYYRKAVVNYISNILTMKEAIYAILMNSSSIDTKPHHSIFLLVAHHDAFAKELSPTLNQKSSTLSIYLREGIRCSS